MIEASRRLRLLTQHQPWDCDGETIEEASSGAIHNGIQTRPMMGFNRFEEATHDHRR
jgi:hypothetical protein